MANRYKDPDELNNRYIPEEDDDEGEYIPEEELTEEQKNLINTIGNITEEGWKQMIEAIMDEEDYTLSEDEYGAKVILAQLNTTNPNIDHDFKLAIAKMVDPDEAVLMLKRLKKKPEEGTNIPQDILEMIYEKAKEYKG